MTQAPEIRFEDYSRLAKWLAGRLMARASQRGLSIDFDDLHQEICMTWVRCRDGFDPSHGVKFSTYFANSVNHNFNRGVLVAKLIGKQPEGGIVSLNKSVSGPDSDSDLTLAEVLEDEHAVDPELMVDARLLLDRKMAADPLLAQVVTLLAAPPPELAAELEAFRCLRQRAIDQGIETRHTTSAAPTTLTLGLLNRIFRFNWREKGLVNAAVQGVF